MHILGVISDWKSLLTLDKFNTLLKKNFRQLKEGEKPQAGDLVVYNRKAFTGKGTGGTRTDRGHVGIYIIKSKNGIVYIFSQEGIGGKYRISKHEKNVETWNRKQGFKKGSKGGVEYWRKK